MSMELWCEGEPVLLSNYTRIIKEVLIKYRVVGNLVDKSNDSVSNLSLITIQMRGGYPHLKI